MNDSSNNKGLLINANKVYIFENFLSTDMSRHQLSTSRISHLNVAKYTHQSKFMEFILLITLKENMYVQRNQTHRCKVSKNISIEFHNA